jgi:hypothetical protein
MMGYVSTLMSIQSAFEKAGIRFLDNEPGAGIGGAAGEEAPARLGQLYDTSPVRMPAV